MHDTLTLRSLTVRPLLLKLQRPIVARIATTTRCTGRRHSLQMGSKAKI